MPKYYRDLIAEMDSNRDGKVTAEEIRQALSVRDPVVRDVVNRLVVKHHSEWRGGRSTGRWEGFYNDLDVLEVKYCEKWQADQEWMSQVPPFDKDEPVWHFHPVVFLSNLADVNTHKRRDNNLGTLSSNYETGGRGVRTVSDGVGDAGGVSYGSYQMTSQTTKKIHGEKKL